MPPSPEPGLPPGPGTPPVCEEGPTGEIPPVLPPFPICVLVCQLGFVLVLVGELGLGLFPPSEGFDPFPELSGTTLGSQ